MSRQRKLARTTRSAAAMEYGLIAILLSAATMLPPLDLGNRLSTTVSTMVWNLRAS